MNEWISKSMMMKIEKRREKKVTLLWWRYHHLINISRHLSISLFFCMHKNPNQNLFNDILWTKKKENYARNKFDLFCSKTQFIQCVAAAVCFILMMNMTYCCLYIYVCIYILCYYNHFIFFFIHIILDGPHQIIIITNASPTTIIF